MKNEVGKLDAVPSKRLYLSIIADYDLNRSVCELVDNGLDVWARSGKKDALIIDITLGESQQTIAVQDNAGGLPKDELRYVVAPGETGTLPTDETIGIFGVGTKRAVVALAQDVKIKTRCGRQGTYEIDFDDTWLQDEDWEIPYYVVDDIAEGSTVVQLQRLRARLTEETIEQLVDHLRTTYAVFLDSGAVTIRVNGNPLIPRFFRDWAYPPNYQPRRYHGVIHTQEGPSVRAEVVAGLALTSSPAAGEYGVYFYCNGRLVARALKTFEVGFQKKFAGLPHPKVSLTRVLIFLNGDARCMPWNSSKSDINTKHPVFIAIHDWLVQVVKDYASLSRNWMGEWPEKVFKYTVGTIQDVEIDDFPTARKSYLPPLPKSRPRHADIVTQKNTTVKGHLGERHEDSLDYVGFQSRASIPCDLSQCPAVIWNKLAGTMLATLTVEARLACGNTTY